MDIYVYDNYSIKKHKLRNLFKYFDIIVKMVSMIINILKY